MPKKNPSRSDRFEEAKTLVSDARGQMETLRDELQEWRDNMPENLQDSAKAGELDEAIQALEDVIGQLEEAENADVTFPSMM